MVDSEVQPNHFLISPSTMLYFCFQTPGCFRRCLRINFSRFLLPPTLSVRAVTTLLGKKERKVKLKREGKASRPSSWFLPLELLQYGGHRGSGIFPIYCIPHLYNSFISSSGY